MPGKLPKITDGMRLGAYGHDFGNFDLCGYLRSGNYQQSIQFPSIYAHGSWADVLVGAQSMGKTVKEYLQPGHYVLEYTNQEGHKVQKFVGKKVYDDGLDPTSTKADRERYWKGNHSIEALMVGSASCLPESEQEYGLYVATGLPVYLYQEQYIQLVREALKGSWAFDLNGHSRRMHVYEVIVMAEGAGGMTIYGKSKNPNELIGAIDIGGYTTDLCVVKNQQVMKPLCASKKIGVATAITRFQAAYEQRHGRSLPLEMAHLIIRQHLVGKSYEKLLDASWKPIPPQDIANLINGILLTIGREIASFTRSIWQDNVLGQIAIMGGGAYYFQEAIKQELRIAEMVADPEMANALGYLGVAQSLMTALLSRLNRQGVAGPAPIILS